MKKRFTLTDLECAHCAAKMEDAIRAMDGVNAVSINFLTQKMTLDADDARFEQILSQAAQAIRKIEPDCRIQM